jgi:RNA polymerase sigma-70 factor (ECF subfamily)
VERSVSRETIAAAIAGDVSAAERLIAAVWPTCFRLAASVTGDAGLAQDAAQEACVIVYNKVGSLRTAAAFESWLYRIVVREARRLRRRHQNGATAAFERGFQSDDAAAMDVWRALAALSPALRDVTVLFYFYDVKSDEIASILGIPHATVRTRLVRARERLRGLLGDYGTGVSLLSSEVTRDAV